jgi:hypothetical protein
MTVKELKQALEGVDENIEVGGAGWFGEFLECDFAEVTEEYIYPLDLKCKEKKTWFCLTIEPAGDEPD